MTRVNYLYNAGGVSEGDALTGPNTGATTTSFNDGAGTFAAVKKGYGSAFGGKYSTGASALQAFQRFPFSSGGLAVAYTNVVTLPLALPAASVLFERLRASAATCGSHNMTSGGNVTFNDSTGSAVSALQFLAATLTAAGIGPGSQILLAVGATIDNTTGAAGQVGIDLYDFLSGTLVGTRTSSAVNLGTVAAASLDVGVVSNSATGTEVGIADIQMEDSSATRLAGLSPPVSSGWSYGRDVRIG